MSMNDYTSEEICDKAEKIYSEKIKHLVEPEQNGRFIVVDIESGDYEIDEDDISAEDRLEERRPGYVGHLLKIGFESAFTVGLGGTKFSDYDIGTK